jgi:hypothetical protein
VTAAVSNFQRVDLERACYHKRGRKELTCEPWVRRHGRGAAHHGWQRNRSHDDRRRSLGATSGRVDSQLTERSAHTLASGIRKLKLAVPALGRQLTGTGLEGPYHGDGRIRLLRSVHGHAPDINAVDRDAGRHPVADRRNR